MVRVVDYMNSYFIELAVHLVPSTSSWLRNNKGCLRQKINMVHWKLGQRFLGWLTERRLWYSWYLWSCICFYREIVISWSQCWHKLETLHQSIPSDLWWKVIGTELHKTCSLSVYLALHLFSRDLEYPQQDLPEIHLLHIKKWRLKLHMKLLNKMSCMRDLGHKIHTLLYLRRASF